MKKFRIPAVLLSLILATGMDKIWNKQVGQWAAGIAPLTGSAELDIFWGVLISIAIFYALGDKILKIFPKLLLVLLLVSQALCIYHSWPLISVSYPQGIDHPAFLFRLKEFKDIFPGAIGSYNPWWNAGIEHFIGVTSGTHGFGLLNFPLVLLMEPETFYAYALHFWIFIGMPWMAVLSLRAIGARWTTSLITGLISCAFVRSEFLFFWQSGNVGSMTTAFLTLPLVALGYKVAIMRKQSWPALALLCIIAWLSCLWTPGYFTCCGLFIGWLLNWRRWTRTSTRRLVIAGAIVLLLLSPWLWATLIPSHWIVKFTQIGVKGGRLAMAKAGCRLCFHHLLEWHPLILVFALAACFSKRSNPTRRWIIPVFVVLSAVALSIGFKNQSQLDRVTIQMAAAAIFPASIYCGGLFKKSDLYCKNRWARFEIAIYRGLVFVPLILGLRIANCHACNKGGFQFWPAEPSVLEFCDWIKQNVPEEGRLAFAGGTFCKYDWGKPAYFPILTHREMMADDYYGYPKQMIQYNYPPKYYRDLDTAGMSFFTKTYGITHWSVSDPFYRHFFDANSNSYEHVASFRMQSSHIDIYAVKDPTVASRFLIGEGRVVAVENKLDVYPESTSDGLVVIKYNWRNGLRCRTPGATIEPYAVDENLTLIGIRPNQAKHVSIGYRPALFKPLQPNFDGTFQH